MEIKKTREEIIKKWKASGLLKGLTGSALENFGKLYQCCKSSKLQSDDTKINGLENVQKENK